ncbi:site-2 protease family protein [Actinomarinicola tropica]|uniref:Peptidase M50 domain-containing protein n=1 Tax=Actinomarinicola tropica TaxID=2789776 RepID=A0A5Q2RLH6_9ACTN|nr:site-2 protease family protein [Actinomarinicola tropica]QGG95431.1 hypothetical protein GH723_10160 [Actinomarinicola tropica]
MSRATDSTTPVPRCSLLAVASALAVLVVGVLRPGALLFLSIIMVSVVAHEAGHFWVARHVGMRPTEFFAGMGPTLWSRRSPRGVDWGVKAFPVGGFVTIPGMTSSAVVDPELEPYTYRAATTWRRLATILAGPAVNLLIAAGLFALVARIGYVGSDGTRSGAGLLDAVRFGRDATWGVITSTLWSLGELVMTVPNYVADLFANTSPDTRFLSPVGATRLTEQAAADDVVTVIAFAAVLNASLGVFNLLPLVPLDGGHALIAVTEKGLTVLRRRPVTFDANRLTPLAVGVIGALVALTATSLWLDIAHPAANPFS